MLTITTFHIQYIRLYQFPTNIHDDPIKASHQGSVITSVFQNSYTDILSSKFKKKQEAQLLLGDRATRKHAED